MKIANKQFKSKESSLRFKEKLSDFKLWNTNGSKWTERAAHPYTYPKQKKYSLCLQVWLVNDQQKLKTRSPESAVGTEVTGEPGEMVLLLQCARWLAPHGHPEH